MDASFLLVVVLLSVTFAWCCFIPFLYEVGRACYFSYLSARGVGNTIEVADASAPCPPPIAGAEIIVSDIEGAEARHGNEKEEEKLGAVVVLPRAKLVNTPYVEREGDHQGNPMERSVQEGKHNDEEGGNCTLESPLPVEAVSMPRLTVVDTPIPAPRRSLRQTFWR